MNEKRRGRPRKYDPDTALAAATAVFHSRGYSAASLDDLAAEMNMTRPSLYNAFGDKAALYQHTLQRFIEMMRHSAEHELQQHERLEDALAAFYLAALDAYLADDDRRGCFVFCTAPAEAANNSEVADTMALTIDEINQALSRRFEQARATGEISKATDAEEAAQMAQAVLHSLALRARSGESRAALQRFIRAAAKNLSSLSQPLSP